LLHKADELYLGPFYCNTLTLNSPIQHNTVSKENRKKQEGEQNETYLKMEYVTGITASVF
jgi:hypothetical protein